MDTTLSARNTTTSRIFTLTDGNVTLEGSTLGITQTAVTTNNGTLSECIAEHNLFTLSYQPLILVSFALNGLLFVAALLDRRKLTRQNYMFACVISTLLSNILYLVFFDWIIIDNYFEKDVAEIQTNMMSVSKVIWMIRSFQCKAGLS